MSNKYANGEIQAVIDSSGTFPYRRVAHNGADNDLLGRQGRGVAVVNFEDAQIYGPLTTRAFTIGTAATHIPRTEYSLVTAIANTSSTATVYLGPSGVTTGTGWPISPGEKVSFEFLANLDFYLIADANGTDVRILEAASRVT